MNLKPRLVISACLLGDEVRYDGNSAVSSLAVSLLPFVEVVKVCPEVELGLGVPRDRIILLQEGEKIRAYQPSTGKDFTQELENFSASFYRRMREVNGFLLKSRSPSCGVSGTKVYADREGMILKRRGIGIFAGKVRELFYHLPIEDEERLLRYPSIRLRFLLGLFLNRAEGVSYRKVRRFRMSRVIELAGKYVPGELKKLWYSETKILPDSLNR